MGGRGASGPPAVGRQRGSALVRAVLAVLVAAPVVLLALAVPTPPTTPAAAATTPLPLAAPDRVGPPRAGAGFPPAPGGSGLPGRPPATAAEPGHAAGGGVGDADGRRDRVVEAFRPAGTSAARDHRTSPPDSGAPGAALPTAAPLGTALPDAGPPGTGPPDTGLPDTGLPDSTAPRAALPGAAPDTAPAEPPPDAAAPPPAAAEGPRPMPPAPPGAGIPAPGAGYSWPLLPAPAVLDPFRGPSQPYGPGHRGVDLAGVVGQPVLAARAGVVVFAGPVAGRGSVSVQHDDGLRTTYEPVAPVVSAGQVVAAGQVLGLLEDGHAACPGTCLHWGARRDRLVYVDPLVLLRPLRVRLLPVPEQWPPRPD